MPLFRPYPVLTLFAAPLLGLLIWLGVWQLQRAGWKQDLIDEAIALSAQPPLTLEAGLCGPAPIMARTLLPQGGSIGREARMFGRNVAGAPGWRLFSIVSPCGDGSALLVETGFERVSAGPEALRRASASARVTRLRLVPWPAEGMFDAANAPHRNEWYAFDAEALATFFGVDRIDPDYILVSAEGMPAHLVQTPPSRHFGYAATWFGMAIALIVMYGVFHARAGRLQIRKKGQAIR